MQDKVNFFGNMISLEDLAALEEAYHHNHETHELVNNILEAIAKEKKQLPAEIKKKFIRNNMAVTLAFWKKFNETPEGEDYNRVEYCPDCKKFSLYFEED